MSVFNGTHMFNLFYVQLLLYLCFFLETVFLGPSSFDINCLDLEATLTDADIAALPTFIAFSISGACKKIIILILITNKAS